jgi:hypothetical protein
MQVTFSSPITDGPAVFAYWWVPDSNASNPVVPVTGTSADVTISSSLPADGSADGAVRYAVVPVTLGLTGTVTTAPVTVAPTNTSATLWVAVYDAAGNVSSGGSPVHQATPYVLSSLSADPAVDYSHGHAWVLDGLSLSGGSVVTDQNATAGTSTTSESDLTLGSAQATASEDLTGNGSDTVFAFDGTTAAQTVTSAQQVVDTTQPFTVSAWIDPSTVTSGVPLIAVSEESAGSGTAAFKLGVSSSSTGYYEFCVRPQAGSGTQVCANGPAAVANTPAFVAGIWDPSNHQIRLLIGNQLAAVAVTPYSLPGGEVSSTGPLLVGADYISGAIANEFNGYITDPSIFPGIVDGDQLTNLDTPRDVNF